MSFEPRASAPTPDPLLGRVLADRYRIHSLIARGGMGAVYRAEHLSLGLACVVKVITVQEVGVDEHRFLERFAREATLTAQLRHPNTVQVFDCGQTPDGIHFLAMELLEGQTLSQAIRASGPFAAARFFRVAKQLTAGVKAAHDVGIVHRDLKPGNIFLLQTRDGDEIVKVLDFGVAKPIQGEVLALTRPGTVMGTPKYMAPEQIMGSPVDARADVYALGVIFFELLVGRVPFAASADVDVMAAHVREPVPSMASVRADAMIPDALEQLVRRMLIKDPQHRIAHLAEVFASLSELEAIYCGGTGAQGVVAPSRVSQPVDDATRPSRAQGAPPVVAEPATVPSRGQSTAPEPAFGVGSLLADRFRIDGRLGEGQSGIVYAGTNEKTGRKVAVKVLHASGEDPQAVVRCMREARSASQVAHPNIVEVYDVGTVEGRPYVVMERLAGGPLTKALESTAIRRAELLSSLVPAMRGLAASHAAGIAHSDLKPSDLIVGPVPGGRTRVTVIDFGVARLIDEPHLRMTRAASKSALPFYAAPEQLRRQPQDHRVDIYAMGVIAYEVVTGRRAFEGRNYGDVAIDIATREVTSPHELEPQIPVELSNAIMKAFARDPSARFQTMQAFIDALAPFTLPADRDPQTTSSLAPEAPGPMASATRPAGFVPVALLLAVIFVAAIGGAAYVTFGG